MLGETGPFSLKREDVYKTIITPYKCPLKVRVYYSDGKTPLQGALVKLYSWNGYRRDYTYRRGKYTNIQGKVSFNCWPTQLADKGEHYLIQVVYKDSVIDQIPRVVVDKDKGANISVTTTLPSLA